MSFFGNLLSGFAGNMLGNLSGLVPKILSGVDGLVSKIPFIGKAYDTVKNTLSSFDKNVLGGVGGQLLSGLRDAATGGIRNAVAAKLPVGRFIDRNVVGQVMRNQPEFNRFELERLSNPLVKEAMRLLPRADIQAHRDVTDVQQARDAVTSPNNPAPNN